MDHRDSLQAASLAPLLSSLALIACITYISHMVANVLTRLESEVRRRSQRIHPHLSVTAKIAEVEGSREADTPGYYLDLR